MRTVHVRLVLAALAATAMLRAQAPAAAQPTVEDAVAKQQAAALAVQKSVARQRASVARQAGNTEKSNGFFILSPPAPMGATVAALTPSADCDPLPASDVDALVQKSAKNQGLDANLLRGVMQQESAFRPCAVSATGAMGLMQLMPATATQFGVPNPFDPADNVEAGATFLKQLLTRYGGDLTLALGAYNAGPAKVDAAAGVPKIPETEDYVKRVLSTLPVKK